MSAETVATPTHVIVPPDDHERHFPKTAEGHLLYGIAIAFSLFQIATAAHLIDMPNQLVRAFHVGFLLLLGFPLVAANLRKGAIYKAMAWGLASAAVAVAVYQYVEYEPLLFRAGDLITMDVVFGVIAIATIFLGAWIIIGPALPIISGIFLAYCVFGEYLPSPLNHRGYDFAQVIDHMAYGTEGIYGVPTFVSSSFIFLFILFGSFLERAGMIKLFTDVSLGLVGHKRGGAAKVSVISSGFMGTISGSGVANVVTTGQFTIPLMKRFGYRPAFAGGVEATSSMGGQIMPPVMGAVAFIMAETLGVEYAEIVKAALIPAILYFASAFWMVHLEAGKRGLVGLDPKDLSSPLQAITKQWYLLLPLAALVWLLFSGYTPLFAGTAGLGLTMLLVLGSSVAIGLSNTVIRTIFWIGLGIAGASFFQYGFKSVLIAIVVLIAWNFFVKGGREALKLSVDSLADGAKTALPVGVACAIVGIIVGTMTLTGAANTFGQFVVAVGEHSLFLSLVLTMLTCIVLGMGIPTIPNYIITSSIAGPALLELGVPLIVSHMFVFYFGILADLTPPMALLIKNAIITLPFTLTSILFIQTLSPMVISYRSRNKSIEVARHKALRAMNIAFGILFVTVFFYAVSFTLAMGHDEAVKAYEQNISALAIAAQFISGAGAGWVKIVSVILNIFAVMTAFFGVYLGFREATQGIVMNVLRRKMPAEKINETLVQRGIMVFAILLAWGAIVLNAPVLSFTSICSPIFGMVGCLIPAWLVYKVPALHKYKGASLYLIIVTGLLLCVSPFLAFS